MEVAIRNVLSNGNIRVSPEVVWNWCYGVGDA
jgi:hypothetical protein